MRDKLAIKVGISIVVACDKLETCKTTFSAVKKVEQQNDFDMWSRVKWINVILFNKKDSLP